MPLDQGVIEQVLAYCERDLPADTKYQEKFNFINDEDLKRTIIEEFKAARYIYKLQEALHVQDLRLHAHSKFQVVQYAAIYEATIIHILNEYFYAHPEVRRLYSRKRYVSAASWPNNLTVEADSEPVYLCHKKTDTLKEPEVKFSDKVDTCVKIGIISEEIGEEIKDFYNYRNSVHLESALRQNVKFDVDIARRAFWRIDGFVGEIKDFLSNNQIEY